MVVSQRQTQKQIFKKQSCIEEKMASEQMSARQVMGPKKGPMMKQPKFNWDTEDKYNGLKNFRLRYILSLNNMINRI